MTDKRSSVAREFDLFISHASEDKASIARRISEYLRQNGYRVWFDEFTLRVGDSLRASIDKGLLRSKYGIVILSKNFLSKNWPIYELDGLFSIEMSVRGNIILPIWHDITRDDVLNYSPTLADRIAIKRNLSNGELLQKISQVIGPPPEPRLRFRRAWVNALGEVFSDCPRCGYAISPTTAVGAFGDYHLSQHCYGCGWFRSDSDWEPVLNPEQWKGPD